MMEVAVLWAPVIDPKKEDVRRRSSETILLFLRVKVGTDQGFP